MDKKGLERNKPNVRRCDANRKKANISGGRLWQIRSHVVQQTAA